MRWSKGWGLAIDVVKVLPSVAVTLDHSSDVNLGEGLQLLQSKGGVPQRYACDMQAVGLGVDVWHCGVVPDEVSSNRGDPAVPEVAQSTLSIEGVSGVGQQLREGLWPRVRGVGVGEDCGVAALLCLCGGQTANLVPDQDISHDVASVVLGVDTPEGL